MVWTYEYVHACGHNSEHFATNRFLTRLYVYSRSGLVSRLHLHTPEATRPIVSIVEVNDNEINDYFGDFILFCRNMSTPTRTLKAWRPLDVAASKVNDRRHRYFHFTIARLTRRVDQSMDANDLMKRDNSKTAESQER
jgi:hypothetical protein